MKIITQPINLIDEDPIELRAVRIQPSIHKYRIEARMDEKYFNEHYADRVFPEDEGAWFEEMAKGIFGIPYRRRVKIIYTNPWTHIDYDIKKRFNYYLTNEYYTVDSREKFDNLKAQIKTYGDYMRMCNQDREAKEKEASDFNYKYGDVWK